MCRVTNHLSKKVLDNPCIFNSRVGMPYPAERCPDRFTPRRDYQRNPKKEDEPGITVEYTLQDEDLEERVMEYRQPFL